MVSEMGDGLIFADLAKPLDAADCRDVAVVGGDVGAVFVAAVLARRGHRVVWYRGDRTNPHPGSGVLRTFAAEPLALPGYPLEIPALLLGNAVRGGLHATFAPEFAAWLLRAAAASRPPMVEAIAADRAALLAQARGAFSALAEIAPVNLGEAGVTTLYRGPRAYASGWAAHDVRRRYGGDFADVTFDDIAERFPHLSPRYTRGMRAAAVPRVENPEALLEALKADLETAATVARHWPERVRPQADGVEIVDGGETRRFDWAVRCEDGGPEAIWPRGRGCFSACLPWRERILVRDVETDCGGNPSACEILVDGTSGAWLERTPGRIVAAGAQRLGGAPGDDLRYLVAASYVRLWRDLAGPGWRDEGGRMTVAQGWVAPDSRPLLGAAGGRVLVAAGFGDLGWTLGPLSGFALAAAIEGNAAAEALAPFSPRRFD